MTATSFSSCLYISGNGNLIEMVDFAGEQVEYVINGISEHIILEFILVSIRGLSYKKK